ncbi:MAG: MlaE family ABC transporter permease [Bacteroidota bacterium]
MIFSMGLSLTGGWLALIFSNFSSTETYIYGIRYYFEMGNIWYALTKCIVFGFIIITISSYHGYYVEGGSLEVGKASTQAVVSSSVAILIANFLLTQMILLS